MPARAALALALLTLLAGLASADDLGTSPVPPPRPATAGAAPPNADAAATALHPQPRPAQSVAGLAEAAPSGPAPQTSPLPPPRPAVAANAPAPTQAAVAPVASAKPGTRGALCGDSAITGAVLAAISSRVKGCGVAAPVSVEFVAGVRINPAATLDCTTAEALKSWVNKGLQPAFAPRKVVELTIFGSYMCRPRNNVRGARISEHGQGKAIDIGAFTMDNGQTWTVADNYNATIRKAHAAACGIFGTTLGPGSDGYHENHLHFDTATYNYGAYCH